MPRIFPTDWKTQIKIFEMFGCKYKRKEGSHHVLTYPDAKRAVVIPEYDEIDMEQDDIGFRINDKDLSECSTIF